jgi:hypothetical protein
MDRAKVSVLEQADKVSLTRLLKRLDGVALEAQFRMIVVCYLAHQPLERELAEEQLGRLLVPADLAQSHSPRAKPVRLLDPASRGRRLASSLRGHHSAGRFASGRLPGGLFRACHPVFSITRSSGAAIYRQT